jgi:hypothetical protein
MQAKEQQAKDRAKAHPEIQVKVLKLDQLKKASSGT